MKKLFLGLAIVLLLGGLFSTVYYGIQWQVVANETSANMDRLESEAEAAINAGDEAKGMEYIGYLDNETMYYREKKDLSELGYMVGIPMLLIAAGFFWKWRKME